MGTPNGHHAPSGKIQVIDLSYDPAQPEASARRLVFALHADWETAPGEVELEALKDGITNTLYKATKKRPGLSEAQVDEEAVLLRSYGNGTDAIIDREREAFSHQLLASRGLAPKLLARFTNGLLYSYVKGTACSPADLRRADVFPATAALLARWHGTIPVNAAPEGVHAKELQYESIQKLLPAHIPRINMWTVVRKWIDVLPSDTAAERERNTMLLREIELCAGTLGSLPGLDQGQYVYSHTDLLSGNVIIQTPEKGDGERQSVRFIDYEYMTPAPAAFDIANHFAEWGGFECDYASLPTRSQRRQFLRSYVASYRQTQREQRAQRAVDPHAGATNGSGNADGHPKLETDRPPPPSSVEAETQEEDDVKRLELECDTFRGMPGLYWGMWGLVQAQISTIDFDYASYAEKRIAEYFAWKSEEDGSRLKSGKEMPLRERRLAEEEE